MKSEGADAANRKKVRCIQRSVDQHWVGDGFPVRTFTPIHVVGYGPFVMNDAEEIQQAVLDYQSGKMGNLA